MTMHGHKRGREGDARVPHMRRGTMFLVSGYVILLRRYLFVHSAGISTD
jgi:hypothetical protein